jgi:hypothetical protein
MKFPSTWILYEDKCSIISGLTISSNSSLNCKNSTAVGYNYLKVNNFLSASVSTQIVINTYVGSPSLIGSYDVYIETGNEMGIMDSMTQSISLNSTYGTLNMLSINAITANSKVPVAKTGPLEMTFFLNYKLPQTNVLT